MRAHTEDTAGFYEADLAFHVAVFAASGNSLIDRLSTIMAPLLQVSFAVQSSVVEQYGWAVGRHERVYLAIARHDADAARVAMRDVLSAYKGEVETINQRQANATGRGDAGIDARSAAGTLAGRLYPSGALHGRLAHALGGQIVSGAIRQGETLPHEVELASRHDVSRQAAREALKVLAAKGLVSTRRRAGTTVAARERLEPARSGRHRLA